MAAIHLDYLLFAVVQHESDGSPTQIGGEYDRIRVPSFPYPYRLDVVLRLRSLWADAGAFGRLSIHLTDADGKALGDPAVRDAAIKTDEDSPVGASVHAQYCLTIRNIVFPRQGTYTVVVRIDDKVVGDRQLHVLQKKISHP